jgi:hypothetical protein
LSCTDLMLMSEFFGFETPRSRMGEDMETPVGRP